MAKLKSLTTYLKLRLTQDLSADAKYNLERIDALIAQGFIIDVPDTVIRSEGDITITPGSGGSVIIQEGLQAFGPSYFDETRWWDQARDNSVGFKAPDTLTEDTTYELPPADGSTGQMLTTDGGGALSWTTPGADANEQQGVFEWPTGTTINLVAHNFGTTDLEVLVYDNNTENFIGVQSIEHVTPNDLKLTAVDPVGALGYRIFIREVL